MKKLLSTFGAGSLAMFVAMFLRVAHFGRTQLLFGSVVDAEMAASGTVSAVIRFLYALLHATATLLRGNGWILLLLVVVLAAAAIFIARRHLLDASLLAAVAAGAIGIFWFLIAPWLFVSNVLQSRGLHPEELIRGSDRISVQARANWSCVVCANVKEMRFRELVCAEGHDPDACATHIVSRFAVAATATVLLAGLIAYIILARGSWLDRARAGSGFVKATLVSLSFLCITAVALDVYAVGYIHGKTTQGFDFPKVRQVQDGFRSDPLFLISRSASAATLFFALDDVRDVELRDGLRLEPDGRANILTEQLGLIAESELGGIDPPF